MIKASKISAKAVALMRERFADAETETLYLICFDNSGMASEAVRIAEGGAAAVDADAREVVRKALKRNANAAVIAHNHPAGSAKPSPQDVSFTKMTAALMAAAGIVLADHIILANDACFSFAASRLYSGALDQTASRR